MRWLMAMLFVSGASYLVWSLKTRWHESAPPPVVESDWTPPVQDPVLTRPEQEKVRASLKHHDPEVRKAALELLDAVRDPVLLERLGPMIDDDPDPGVRRLAARLLDRGGSAAMAGLVRGLNAVEPNVRVASLDALGKIGDPSTAPFIARVAVEDVEPEVRAAALRTLQSFQDKRIREYRALAEQLKKAYERTLHGDQ